MRKANGALSVFAALVLLFQAGTTVVSADDGRPTSVASPESHVPLAMLGGVFVRVGVWLLRRPREIPPDP
jgi:hypothetical protein